MHLVSMLLQNATMTYNEPASCFYLECPDGIDCFNRFLVIEGESAQETQEYCVEILGAPDLPGTDVPFEPTCGAPIAHCGRVDTDRISRRDGVYAMKIRFSCRQGCPETAIIPYTFRAYLSAESYDLDDSTPIVEGEAAGSDVLDQYCDANLDYADFPSAKNVADCSTGLCPLLKERVTAQASTLHVYAIGIAVLTLCISVL